MPEMVSSVCRMAFSSDVAPSPHLFPRLLKPLEPRSQYLYFFVDNLLCTYCKPIQARDRLRPHCNNAGSACSSAMRNQWHQSFVERLILQSTRTLALWLFTKAHIEGWCIPLVLHVVRACLSLLPQHQCEHLLGCADCGLWESDLKSFLPCRAQ